MNVEGIIDGTGGSVRPNKYHMKNLINRMTEYKTTSPYIRTVVVRPYHM